MEDNLLAAPPVVPSLPQESTQRIQGNAPLPLTDPAHIHLVQSGAVAVFATRLINGAPEGDRHYLFTVSPGEALLGAELSSEQAFGLIAVAIEPTDLGTWSIAALDLTEFCPLLEGWIQKLSQVEELPKPEPTRPLDLTQFISLVNAQTFQPPKEQICWVESRQGAANWLGYEALKVQPASGVFPLAGTWLSACSALELQLFNTLEIGDHQRLQQGLTLLHRYFLTAIDLLEQDREQTEFLRFQQRQQLNRQAAQETLRSLVSVLKPQGQEQPTTDDELLMVAGAVGRALGVRIEPPSDSDDPNRVRNPLESIARASRLRLRRVLLRDQWWQKESGAIIAYRRDDGRPVALLPMGDRYTLFDPRSLAHPHSALPATQPRRYPAVTASLAAQLVPTAYTFYRPLPAVVAHAWDLTKFALHHRWKDLLIFVGMGIGVTVINLLVPLATGLIIDQALPIGDRRLLIQVGLGLLFAAIGAVSLELIQAIAALRLNLLSESSLQAAVWDRLLMLKPTFFRNYAIGDLESRVSGISQIYTKLTGATLQTLLTSTFALISFGLMLAYSPSLALVVLPIALFSVAVTVVSGIALLKQKRPLLELEGDIFGLLVQLLSAVPKLRNAGAEERAFAAWGQRYTKRLTLDLHSQAIEDGVTLVNTIVPSLTYVALFWVMAGLIQQAQFTGSTALSVGTFLAFSAAFGIFISGVTNLSNTVTKVLDVVTLWQRSKPILEADTEIDDEKTDPGRLLGQLHVDHVTFRYREDGSLTLDQVSIHAEPGEFIALVGPSGSGKSTLLRLLLGFETPIDGTVYYDGQDLSGLDVMAVRRQLGVVLQTSRINAGTIFENISANAVLALSEAWQAAEMAGLADDIHALPMGMHTVISEGGSNFSGGQRQRLMIARALALKPRILLFDEATSALDNRTQAIVTASLDSLGVTRVVVAHRLSTIRNADRIYVMEAGRITQQGTFEQLAQVEGLFAQLIARQLSEGT